VEEPPSKPSLEERLKETLNRVDEFSKSASQAMRKGFDKTKKRVSETSESIDTNEMMEKTKAGISTINSQLSSVAKKAEVGKRASGLLALMYTVGQRVERLIFWIISFAPYLIPTTIILQSALWVAFLSDGTTSNAIVSEYAENMGENSRLSWIALSIFGAAIAFLLVSNFDSSNEALDSLANSSAFDIIVVLLVVSSILYLFKSYKSLYFLSLAFIGSIVIRMIETDFSELNWFLALLCLLCLFGTFSALSLPFVRNRFSSMDNTLSEGTVIIDQIESSKILSHEFSEPSYLMHPFDDIDWNMDNAPIQPPKRPSRRSEYELYEWVGLLANLVLWPTTLAISMLIGSGYEIDGTALSMEDNSIMLLGPAAMTAFFFLMQYRMDSSARDGSLYAAQKQAYLDEMEKYVEAKKAYLELVTLQAQIKIEQLTDGESE
tara:strand:+ start:404 stop:1708 length:1305 start_codon:yes stop_codon:yes gene_type:complete